MLYKDRKVVTRTQAPGDRATTYLDLESAADRARLAEPELYFADHEDELVKETLLGHPVARASWEGMAIESIAAIAGDALELSFYRTSGGAEVDLVLSWLGGED